VIGILVIPIITAVICYNVQKPHVVGYVSLAGAVALAGYASPVIVASLSASVSDLSGTFSMDALSGYIMALVIFLSLASAIYSISYLEHEYETGLMNLRGVRTYYGLFHLFVFTMLLVCMADNLAVMWIGIEATTIVSALLIGLGFHKRPLAVEAAWKYIILCTVGITFALLGTFITYYASTSVMGTEGALNWTVLHGVSRKLNPETMKLAFIFVLVGYGTKAGLAPVHNWLPDAHSQAPSPISALLSGILLNTAFYGIMRFVMIVEPSTGSAFTGNLLVIFGLVSLGISAIFILVQDNYKRLLAYSSIEHMGIISLGIGIGGPIGIYGALLHILNHALAKPLMFFASKDPVTVRVHEHRKRERSAHVHAAPGNADIHRRIVALRFTAVQYICERVHHPEGGRGQGYVVRGRPVPVLRGHRVLRGACRFRKDAIRETR
jgi:hydrogenase-4 component F